jgi:hypothetical protein
VSGPRALQSSFPAETKHATRRLDKLSRIYEYSCEWSEWQRGEVRALIKIMIFSRGEAQIFMNILCMFDVVQSYLHACSSCQ